MKEKIYLMFVMLAFSFGYAVAMLWVENIIKCPSLTPQGDNQEKHESNM